MRLDIGRSALAEKGPVAVIDNPGAVKQNVHHPDAGFVMAPAPTPILPETANPLWSLVREASLLLPGAVLIGGLAVEAHTTSAQVGRSWVTVWSHDIDLMASTDDIARAQRDEEVVRNLRLRKREIRKPQADVDVYVDREHGLCVPYPEVWARRVVWEGLSIACVGHLIALKTAALLDRGASGKGAKDAEDLARLLLLAGPGDPALARPWMAPEQVSVIARVAGDSRMGARLAGHPGPEAARCRRALVQAAAAYRIPSRDSSRRP